MPSASDTAAIEGGISAIGGTFNGITTFMGSNFLFGALMALTLVGVGVGIFKRLVRRLGGRRA